MTENSTKRPLDAPPGQFKKVVTPWGAVEGCIVVTMPSLSGEYVEYASVYKPVSKPGVRWSVFEIK